MTKKQLNAPYPRAVINRTIGFNGLPSFHWSDPNRNKEYPDFGLWARNRREADAVVKRNEQRRRCIFNRLALCEEK